MPPLRSSANALRLVCVVVAIAASSATAEEWEASISPFAPGSFPEPRALRAEYRFGWGGLTAASGEVRFGKTADGRFEFEATGGTTGMARTLWAYDVKHVATSDAKTLRPLKVREVETVKSKKFSTEITYDAEGATSVREEVRGDDVKSKRRHFGFTNLWSLDSALLYLRTQPLENGAVQRLVVYPSTSAYLTTITVEGRERITVPTGTYNAIKVDVQLKKIGKKRVLQRHKKFRRATVWMSDDSDRLLLRIETQVFIGAVFAELESVEFGNAKP